MEIIKTPIPDLLIIKPRVFGDARGFFCETYNEKTYHDAGINLKFCQDNQSKSSYGVIRGLHYQLYPQSQSKLVSAAVGSVWDVAVDLRKDSPTFGQWFGVELSEENHLQFLIPQPGQPMRIKGLVVGPVDDSKRGIEIVENSVSIEFGCQRLCVLVLIFAPGIKMNCRCQSV